MLLATKMKIKKMRRRTVRRKRYRKILMGALFGISITITSQSIIALCNNKTGMDYGVISENGVISYDSNETINVSTDNYDLGERVIIVYCDDEIKIRSTRYNVKDGDTLWSIAKDYCNDSIDVRSYINKVYEVNNIETLKVGDSLDMPVI